MIHDPIVEEVRQARRQTEKDCGHDWKQLTEHYRQVQLNNGRLIRRQPKLLSRAPDINTPH